MAECPSFGKELLILLTICSVCIISILSTKRNVMFLFAIWGVKIIDLKNCLISAVLPCYKDLDCTVPS